MNRSLAFYGRNEVVSSLRTLYAERKNVFIFGPAGIGKTAVLRHLNQSYPMLFCETTSSLRRICDNLELQLGWTHYKRDVVERKNRLLSYLQRREEPVVFDQVALTPPRVARFIAHLLDRIPV